MLRFRITLKFKEFLGSIEISFRSLLRRFIFGHWFGSGFSFYGDHFISLEIFMDNFLFLISYGYHVINKRFIKNMAELREGHD